MVYIVKATLKGICIYLYIKSLSIKGSSFTPYVNSAIIICSVHVLVISVTVCSLLKMKVICALFYWLLIFVCLLDVLI